MSDPKKKFIIDYDGKSISMAEFWERKRKRRAYLASLPIEEKFEILKRMQKMANEIRVSQGREPRQCWK